MEETEVDKLLKSKDISTSESPQIIYKKGEVLYVLDEGHIKTYTAEVIESMIADSRKKNDFGVNNVLLQRLLEVKKTWWPSTQKSLTGTFKDFNTTLKTWIDERKKIIEESPEYEIVPYNNGNTGNNKKG